MNCDEFQNVVTDLARDQMMEATARTEALTHCTHCDDCALLLENERRLTTGLRSLASQMESLEAGPLVEARLLAAFRNRVAMAPVAVRSSRWYWAGAAAAAVLLVFGVVTIRGRIASTVTPQGTQAQDGVIPKTPTPNRDQVVREPEPQQSIDVALGPRQHRNVGLVPAGLSSRPAQPAPAVVSDSANNEIATDFFPVGDGRAVNLQDGGQLMRVEVPRSTMARFGLPVNFERSNERVKADVLVSTDGLARAIRFVQ